MQWGMSEQDTRPGTRSRVVRGLLVAPAIPPAVVCAAGFATAPGHFFEVLWSAQFLALISYSAAIALGVPCYLILQARNVSTLSPYVLSGAAIGMVFSIAFSLTIFLSHLSAGWDAVVAGGSVMLSSAIRSTSVAAVFGAVSSAVFWAISVRSSDR
jgi:hypothetical protein